MWLNSTAACSLGVTDTSQQRPSSSPTSALPYLLGANPEEEPENTNLHFEINKKSQFRIMISAFCILFIGSSADFFARFVANFDHGYGEISWKSPCLGLFPDLIATVCGFRGIFVFLITSPFFEPFSVWLKLTLTRKIRVSRRRLFRQQGIDTRHSQSNS